MSAPKASLFRNWESLQVSYRLSYRARAPNLVPGRMWKKERYLVFFQELWGESPRCIPDDFIHVATVSQGFVSLSLIHHSKTFELVSKIITAD